MSTGEKFYWSPRAAGIVALIIIAISIIVLASFMAGMYRHPGLDVLLLIVVGLITYFVSVQFHKKYIGG